jgi:release factor glutamine methyltransferase
MTVDAADAVRGGLTSDALDWAAVRLQSAGVGDARREALRLWSALSGRPVGATWLERRQAADPSAVRQFRTAVERRCAGMPMAYAVGRAAFRTLDLLADQRALIPRPETEGLVERVLSWAGSRPGGIAADVGTGSGCIALALAVEGAFDRIVATDRSAGALALAGENLQRVRPRTPVELRLGDWLEPLAGERCHVVVANPPYLRDDEWATLDPGVREFEPPEALHSGPDGLAATRALLHHASDVLILGGLLAVEVDERRADSVAALARDTGWRDVAIHHDLFDRPRYLVAVL